MRKLLILLILPVLFGCTENVAVGDTESTKGVPSVQLSSEKKDTDNKIETETEINDDMTLSKDTMTNTLGVRQKHEISLTVPDSTWSLNIHSVIEQENAVAVIARVSQVEGMMGMQVISEVVVALEFLSDKPIKTYIVGKGWNWDNAETYEFIEDPTAIEGRSIAFTLVEPSRKGGPKKQSIGTPL